MRDHLYREQNKRQPTSKEELQETWRTVPEDFLKKLQKAGRKRVQAVLKSKNGHTYTDFQSLLESYKPLFGLIYIHVCRCFDTSMYVFFIFLGSM